MTVTRARDAGIATVTASAPPAGVPTVTVAGAYHEPVTDSEARTHLAGSGSGTGLESRVLHSVAAKTVIYAPT